MPSRNLSDLTKELQTIALTIVERFNFENLKDGLYMKVICTHRSPEEQKELFKKGRDEIGNIIDRKKVVTYCDGERTKSKHNFMPSKAFDVGIFKKVNGKETYLCDRAIMASLNRYTAGLNVRWGGIWKSPKTDYPHFEEV